MYKGFFASPPQARMVSICNNEKGQNQDHSTIFEVKIKKAKQAFLQVETWQMDSVKE